MGIYDFEGQGYGPYLDKAVDRAVDLLPEFSDREGAEMHLARLIGDDMNLHRGNLARVIALAAVRLADPRCGDCTAPVRLGVLHVCMAGGQG